MCESVCGHRDADIEIADADAGPSLACMISAIDCFTRSGWQILEVNLVDAYACAAQQGYRIKNDQNSIMSFRVDQQVYCDTV